MAVLPTKQLLGTTAWVEICAAPVDGKVRRLDLSATNVEAGGAIASASCRIVDTAPGNTGVRRNAYPLPAYPDPDSTVMLEYGLMLTANQSYEVKASAANAVAFSAEIQEMDAADA